MVADSRVAGEIRDDVFSDDVSFKIVDLQDRPIPAYVPKGKRAKLPLRNVLISYTTSHAMLDYKVLNSLILTSFPSDTNDKNDFGVSTHNSQFEDFFEPYSLRKNTSYRFSVDNFILPTLLKPRTESYDTAMVFVCVKGLENARALLVNKKEYRVIGILNLSAEKRWRRLRRSDNHFSFTLSDDSLSATAGQHAIGVKHLTMSFVSKKLR